MLKKKKKEKNMNGMGRRIKTELTTEVRRPFRKAGCDYLDSKGTAVRE